MTVQGDAQRVTMMNNSSIGALCTLNKHAVIRDMDANACMLSGRGSICILIGQNVDLSTRLSMNIVTIFWNNRLCTTHVDNITMITSAT